MLRRVLLILILFGLLSGTAQARHLTVGLPCLNDDCELPRIEAFFREAYKRIGVEVDFVALPSLLELDFADSGQTDASALRTRLVIAGYQNLVAVPCPLARVDFVACSVDESIRIGRVAELSGRRIGINRGDLTAGMLCRKAGVDPVMLNSLLSGIRMMEEGRLDVILEERNTMRRTLAMVDAHLYCSGSLHQEDLYHWLNKSKADLTGPLAEVFRAMIDAGEARRIFGECAYPSPAPSR
jgi:ABC-type amino acid transport substrate-binding protein